MKEKILLTTKPVRCPLCHAWFDRIWSASRKLYVLACHFDKIAIAETDPFVGRWEEANRGEKVPCPNCDHAMRYFATSTGYMQAKCPKKKCGAKIESAAPDRKPGAVLVDAKGDVVGVPGVDRPVATPENLGPTQ